MKSGNIRYCLLLGVSWLCATTPLPGQTWESAQAVLSGADMYKMATDIVAIAEESRERTMYCGRFPGSPEDRKTARYMAEHLAGAGIGDVRVESFPFHVVRPDHWKIAIGPVSELEMPEIYVPETAYPSRLPPGR